MDVSEETILDSINNAKIPCQMSANSPPEQFWVIQDLHIVCPQESSTPRLLCEQCLQFVQQSDIGERAHCRCSIQLSYKTIIKG